MSESSDDRRRFARKPISTPLNISAGVRRDRVGVIRDLSASGVLFHSLSQFAPGERVVIQFKVNHTHGSTTGHVVRATTDTNPENVFRHLTAVRFDAPLLDLAPALDM